jgi:hypothetical protein
MMNLLAEMSVALLSPSTYKPQQYLQLYRDLFIPYPFQVTIYSWYLYPRNLSVVKSSTSNWPATARVVRSFVLCSVICKLIVGYKLASIPVSIA